MTAAELSIEEHIKKAKHRIVFVGINSAYQYLVSSSRVFANLLKAEPDLSINIFCESGNENFSQSLSTSFGTHEARFSTLEQRKSRILGHSKSDLGLIDAVRSEFSLMEEPAEFSSRLTIKQLNLRAPANLICVDEKIFKCITFSRIPLIEDYELVCEGAPELAEIQRFLSSNIFSLEAQNFHSRIGDELITVTDSAEIPRAVVPRSALNTTDFGRKVVWVFVFNRHGKLLLQKRSKKTKDNRLMWDKSIGGHVDLADSSTSETAKRELIEEIYLPNAEFTKYVKADVGEVVDFGEMNFDKRPERYLSMELRGLGDSDWAMFRAIENGVPLSIKRASERTLHDDESGEVSTYKTVFNADVFYMIAPYGQFDDLEQAQSDIPSGEFSAVSDRVILFPNELNAWIEDETAKKTHAQTFTDDLLYINSDYRDILESFSEFVRFVGSGNG